MNGTTSPRLARGTQMADYKAVTRRKQADPELTTMAAIRLAAKARRKSPAAVQQSYYKIVRTLAEQGAAPQPVRPKPTTPKKPKVAASIVAKQSLAGAARALENLERENARLLKRCDDLAAQNKALRDRLAAIRAAL